MEGQVDKTALLVFYGRGRQQEGKEKVIWQGGQRR